MLGPDHLLPIGVQLLLGGLKLMDVPGNDQPGRYIPGPVS